ncbi:Uncharacterised protein r2_g2212 [Pycnogonum litorale]
MWRLTNKSRNCVSSLKWYPNLFCFFSKSKLSELHPLTVPKKPVEFESSSGHIDVKESVEKNEGQIGKLTKWSGRLLTDLHDMTSCPQVVDISKRRTGNNEPVGRSSAPSDHIVERSSKLWNLRNDADRLNQQIVKLLTVHGRGGASSKFCTFPTSDFSKAMAEKKKGELLGKVIIPSTKEDVKLDRRDKRQIALDIKSINRLHNLFVN